MLILIKKKKIKNIIYYKMIFKAKKIASKKNYYFEFEINCDKYIISFETNEKTIFIYDVTIQVGIKSALEKIKDINKVDKLYKDSINRTYNGNKINENILLIGACNPYRKRKEN